jgi:hypothetical protein
VINNRESKDVFQPTTALIESENNGGHQSSEHLIDNHKEQVSNQQQW